jgi:hypothetical protein
MRLSDGGPQSSQGQSRPVQSSPVKYGKVPTVQELMRRAPSYRALYRTVHAVPPYITNKDRTGLGVSVTSLRVGGIKTAYRRSKKQKSCLRDRDRIRT